MTFLRLTATPVTSSTPASSTWGEDRQATRSSQQKQLETFSDRITTKSLRPILPGTYSFRNKVSGLLHHLTTTYRIPRVNYAYKQDYESELEVLLLRQLYTQGNHAIFKHIRSGTSRPLPTSIEQPSQNSQKSRSI